MKPFWQSPLFNINRRGPIIGSVVFSPFQRRVRQNWWVQNWWTKTRKNISKIGKIFSSKTKQTTQQSPCWWIVSMQIKFRNNQNICVGTGTIIKIEGRWYVLTCAHNILQQPKKGDGYLYAQYIKIYSQLKNMPATFVIDQLSFLNCWFDERYLTQVQNQHNFQFALINLNDQLKKKYPQIDTYKLKLEIQFGWRKKNYQQVGLEQLTIIGYSYTQLKKNNFQFQTQKPLYVFGKRTEKIPQKPINLNKKQIDISKLVFYQLTTYQGQSGSPIIIQNDGKYKIVAIHKGSEDKKQKDKKDKNDKKDISWYNIGVCFNDEKEFKELIPQNFKEHQNKKQKKQKNQ